MGILTLLNCYILLYVLLKLQRGAQYIFNVVLGNVFIIVEALLLHKQARSAGNGLVEPCQNIDGEFQLVKSRSQDLKRQVKSNHKSGLC